MTSRAGGTAHAERRGGVGCGVLTRSENAARFADVVGASAGCSCLYTGAAVGPASPFVSTASTALPLPLPLSAALPLPLPFGSSSSSGRFRTACTTSRCALYTSACRSAPEKPSVSSASCSRSTPGARCSLRASDSMISCRSILDGMSHRTALSRRPGRSSAGSIRSGRLVAASTYTPSRPCAPSISVSIWFTTRSVTPVLSCPLLVSYERATRSLPFGGDRIELVEEEHAGLGRTRALEQVAHALLRRADVLVQDLGALHADEVEAALLCDR